MVTYLTTGCGRIFGGMTASRRSRYALGEIPLPAGQCHRQKAAVGEYRPAVSLSLLAAWSRGLTLHLCSFSYTTPGDAMPSPIDVPATVRPQRRDIAALIPACGCPRFRLWRHYIWFGAERSGLKAAFEVALGRFGIFQFAPEHRQAASHEE